MEDLIIFEKIKTQSDHFIGKASLNRKDSLNALNVKMINLLIEKLSLWERDEKIACIFLDSKLKSAFCVGGDVKALVQENDFEKSKRFFAKEYAFFCFLRSFKTPIISWANSYVLGGGAGLFFASHYPVITEDVKFSMPEGQIGFFNDVGSSYFFQKMQSLGLFFALSSCFVEAQFLRFLYKDSFLLNQKNKDLFLEKLQERLKEKKGNFKVIKEVLSELEIRPKDFLLRKKEIKEILSENSLEKIDEKIRKHQTKDPFMKQALLRYQKSSPLSQKLIFRLFEENKDKDLKECLFKEWNLACIFFEKSEMKHGIKSLLIDKKKETKWKYPSLDLIKDDLIHEIFSHKEKPDLFHEFLESFK